MANSSVTSKPSKPYPDFPLYAHASGRWAKKINGKVHYFGSWTDPDAALAKFEALQAGHQEHQVIATAPSGKPDKPYPDFPLYAHATGRWAKKIKGRQHYFGSWDDPAGALELYNYQWPFLQDGRTPPPRNQEALTVGDLVNGMLEHKELRVESGEMSRRTWDDYKRTGETLIRHFGRHTTVESLTTADFASLRKRLGKSLGLVALGNEIGRCRVFFNFAYKNDQLDRPVRMGLSFSKPSKKAVKKQKQSKAEKVFSVAELRTLFHAADKQMRAFILLALNGGLGNGDLGQLEPKHLQAGWIVYPRPKTLVDRRFPLWPETIKAIEQTKQTKYPELPWLFVTKYGQCWYRDSAIQPLSAEFRKLCQECGLHQVGRGFYSLRHTFRTVADGCRDQVAINHVMGHSDESMASTYREWIEPDRLQAVVDHVRKWAKPMFRKPAKKVGAK